MLCNSNSAQNRNSRKADGMKLVIKKIGDIFESFKPNLKFSLKRFRNAE